MERFAAEGFYKLATWMANYAQRFHQLARQQPSALVDDESINTLQTNLEAIENWCKQIHLRDSLDRIAELKANLLKKKRLTYRDMEWQLTEQSDCIRREMKRTLFLYISQPDAERFLSPRKGWGAVCHRWRDSSDNIEESAKSFACGRYAASVFHILLVAEVGIIAVGELIGLKDPKPGWSGVIGQIRRIVQDKKYNELTPSQQEHYPLLQQLLPLMLAMQEAWRNKITHSAHRLTLSSSVLSRDVADDIISTTRAFMKRLVSDLPEKDDPNDGTI